MRSSVDVPLDIDRCAGDPEIRVGLAEGLHHRQLQWQAACVRDEPRHRIELGLDEFRAFHKLVRHGLGEPERNEFFSCCAYTLLFRAEEYLGARPPMGPDCILLQDVKGSHQCEWMVISAAALYRQHLRLQHGPNRPDTHRR